MVCFAVFAVNAQNYLLQESFEGGVIPAGWTSIDQDGDGYEWDAAQWNPDFNTQLAATYSHTGNGVIASASYINNVGELTPNNWLITSAITVPAANTTPTLSFWARVYGYTEPIEVLVSTTGATVADFTSPAILTQSITSDDYAQFTADLSAYAGQTIYIAFVHRNSTDNYWLFLDDVEVYNFTDPVMTVTPTSFDFGSVIVGNAATRTANVFTALLTSNVTVTTAAPFSVSLDGTTYNTTVSMPTTGGSLYVQYNPTAAGTHNGTVTLTSGTLNQTITLTGVGVDCSNEGAIPYTEGFNYNGDLPVCWTFVYGSGDPTVNTITAFAEDTTINNYAVRFNSYSSSSDYNQYMISPAITYTGAAAQLELSAMVRAYNTSGEKFAFGYSTTTADTSAFIWGAEQTVSSTTYENRYMLIPSNARFVAIHYFSNYQYYMYVDEISVVEPQPEIRTDVDTIEYGIVYLGENATDQVSIDGVVLTSGITATVAAPFTVSSDSVNFAATATLPQVGGTLYVKYTPSAVAHDTAVVTLTATGATAKTITVIGEGYDCTGAISAIPYTATFNEAIVPPLCWTAGNSAGLAVGQMDTIGVDNAIVFTDATYMVTPLIETAHEDMWASFEYVTYAAVNGYTSSPATTFRIGYSTTTNDYSAFTWGAEVAAEDNSALTSYREYVPAAATYVAVEVTGLGSFLYYGFFQYPSYLFVDNFTLVEAEPEIVANPAAINFGAIEVNTTATETSNITGIRLTENISATTVAPFSISIDGTTFDTTAVLVPAGGTLYVRFAPTAEGSFNGTVALSSDTLNAVITLSGSANDCSTPANLPFTEDFEAELTACWTLIDNDNDGNGWYNVSELGLEAHDGTGAFTSASYINNVGALTPDNWLITPALVIPAEGGYISWYDAAQDASYPEEHYELMVSTTGTAVADFTSVWEITLSTDAWTERVVDLAAYANQTIHIAFVHNECTDAYMMKIDDINVQAGAAPVSVEENAANAVSMYPNPASTVLNVSAENFDNVQIINFLGQVVYSANITENNFQINVSNLSNGVYFLRLNGENVVTKKFVKR